jgi:hypothetical protein
MGKNLDFVKYCSEISSDICGRVMHFARFIWQDTTDTSKRNITIKFYHCFTLDLFLKFTTFPAMRNKVEAAEDLIPFCINLCSHETIEESDERKGKAASLMWRLALNPNNMYKFVVTETLPSCLITVMQQVEINTANKMFETYSMLTYTLMSNSSEIRNKFRELSGICKILVQLLSRAMEFDKAGGNVCAIIGVLCEDHESTKQAFADIQGGCQSVIKYLTKHQTIVLSVKQACKAISWLARNENARKQLLPKKSNTQLFHTLLSHHINDASVVSTVCMAILALLLEFSKTNVSSVPLDPHFILTALRKYKSNMMLVIMLLKIMTILQFERHAAVYMDSQWTLIEVFEAQLAHGAEVNALCFKGLYKMASDYKNKKDQDQQKAIMTERIAPLIVSAMERYYKDEVFTDAFLSTLQFILTTEATHLIEALSFDNRFWQALYDGCKFYWQRRDWIDRWTDLVQVIVARFPSSEKIIEVPGYIEFCTVCLQSELKRVEGDASPKFPCALLNLVMFADNFATAAGIVFQECPQIIDIWLEIIPRKRQNITAIHNRPLFAGTTEINLNNRERIYLFIDRSFGLGERLYQQCATVPVTINKFNELVITQSIFLSVCNQVGIHHST